jgi:hypothetical protein
VLIGDNVVINGVIDVASHRGMPVAPGGNATQCLAFGSTPVAATNGAGGGAAGSFMTKGGDGAKGENATSLGGTAAAADTVAPTVLRGGCGGQTGATGTQAAGAPGAGGGAIYIAASRLSLPSSGAVNVSGAGGVGGGTFAGGSGAGSGGMIVIYTYQLLAGGGRLVANGGGAASGGGTSAGVSGEDPSTTAITTAALGGVGGGGRGGNGFAGVTQAQTGVAQNNRGGGGGGGGGGYVRSNIALAGVSSSPAISVVP